MRPQYTRQQFVRVCDCGCGQPTLISLRDWAEYGLVRGQPLPRLHKHGASVKPRQDHQGRYLTDDGYWMVYAPEYASPGARGWALEHRVVAARTLGRRLRDDEVCHHANGQKTDNRPENICVMRQSEHARLHQPDVVGFGDRKQGWARDYAACIDCGTTTRRYGGNGRCDVCHVRHWRKLQKERRDP